MVVRYVLAPAVWKQCRLHWCDFRGYISTLGRKSFSTARKTAPWQGLFSSASRGKSPRTRLWPRSLEHCPEQEGSQNTRLGSLGRRWCDDVVADEVLSWSPKFMQLDGDLQVSCLRADPRIISIREALTISRVRSLAIVSNTSHLGILATSLMSVVAGAEIC